TQFGLPIDEEQRQLIETLKTLKQKPNESIRLHSATFSHLVSLIGTNHFTETE
ncbi:hypothetical protein EDC96DRAFT_427119, partial [Choanephora cucurbitarum]